MGSSVPMWQDLGGVSKDAYEWLYFDVMNAKDRTHVSIDFLAPNPFDPRVVDPNVDPRDRVGMIACVSQAGKPGIEIDFLADRTQLEYSGDSLTIGGSSVTRRAGRGLPIYDIVVDAQAVDGSGRRMTGKVTYESLAAEWSIPGNQYYQANNAPDQYHRWVVHIPRAKTTGHITVDGPEGHLELDIDGYGYHDHNYGTVSLAATVKRWFWARGADHEHTVIAAHLIPRDAIRHHEWLDNVVYVGTKARVVAGAVDGKGVFSLENLGLGTNGVDYPARVSVESNDLEKAPIEIAFAHRKMAIDGHPGYLRRYVDLSLGLGSELPHVFTAVAEDIVFP